MFSLKISDNGDMDVNSLNVGKGIVKTNLDGKVGVNLNETTPQTAFQVGEGIDEVSNDQDIVAMSLYTTGNYIPLQSNKDASIFISTKTQDQQKNATGVTFGRKSEGGTSIPLSRISGSGKDIPGTELNINGDFLIDNFDPLNDYVTASYQQNVIENVRLLRGSNPVITGIGYNASLTSITFTDRAFYAVSETGDRNQVYVSANGNTWIQRVTIPGSYQWSALTFGLRRIVVGSDRIMYSDDGIDWVESSQPFPQVTPISSMTFGNNRFVAVTKTVNTTTGSIINSTDGISWTVSLSFSPRDYSGVSFGIVNVQGIPQSFFIAVSKQGISRSTDGIFWTDVLNVDNFTSVTFGEQQVVATTSDGKIYYSLDGSVWVLSQSTPNLEYTGVAFGNGLYTACASNGISVSRDGITWDLKISTPGEGWKSVAFGNNIFVVVGNNRSLTISTIVESSIIATIDRIIPELTDKVHLNIIDGDATSGVYNVAQLETINGSSTRLILTNPSRRIIGRADGRTFVSAIHSYSRTGNLYTVSLNKLVPEEYDDIQAGDTIYVRFIDNIDLDAVSSTYAVSERLSGSDQLKFIGKSGPLNILNADCLLFRGTYSNRMKISSEGKVGFSLEPSLYGLETSYDIGVHGGIYNSYSSELTATIHNKSGDLVAAEDGKPVDIFVPEVTVKNVSYSRVGSTVSMTTLSPHDFQINDEIRITKANGGLLPGDFKILSVTDFTFTFVDENSGNVTGSAIVVNLTRTNSIQTNAWMYTLENKSNIGTNQTISPGLAFTVVVEASSSTVFSIRTDRSTPASSIPSVESYQFNQGAPIGFPAASLSAITFRPGIYGYTIQAYNPSRSNTAVLSFFDQTDRKITIWKSLPLSKFPVLDTIIPTRNGDFGSIPSDTTVEFDGVFRIDELGPYRIAYDTSLYQQDDRLALCTISITPLESAYNKATFTSTAYDDLNNIYVSGSIVTQNNLNAGLFQEGDINSRVGPALDISPVRREQGVVYKLDPNGKYQWSINFYSSSGNVIVTVSVNNMNGDVYILASLSNTTFNNITYTSSNGHTGSVSANVVLFRFDTNGVYLSNTRYNSISEMYPMGVDVSNDNHISLAIACRDRIRALNSSGTVISTFNPVNVSEYTFPDDPNVVPQNVEIDYSGIIGQPSQFIIDRHVNTSINTTQSPNTFELKEDVWQLSGTLNTSDASSEELVYNVDYSFNSSERIITSRNPIGETSIFKRYIYGGTPNTFAVGVSKIGQLPDGESPINLRNGVPDQQGNYYLCTGNYTSGSLPNNSFGPAISFQSFGQSIPGSFEGIDIGKLMVKTYYNTSPVSYSYMRISDVPSDSTRLTLTPIQPGELINHNIYSRYNKVQEDSVDLSKNPGFNNVYIQYLPLNTLFGLTGPYTRDTDNIFIKDPIITFADVDPPGGEVKYNIVGNYTLIRVGTTTFVDIEITEGSFQDFLPSQLYFDVITGIAKPGIFNATYTPQINPSSVRLTLPPGVYDITSGICSLNPPHDFIRKRDNTHIFSADKLTSTHFSDIDLHNIRVNGNILQTSNPNASRDLFHEIQSGIQQLVELDITDPDSLTLSGSFRSGEKLWLKFGGGEILPFIVSSSDRFRSIVVGSPLQIGDVQSAEILNSYTSSAGNVTVRFPETNMVETTVLNSRFVKSGNTFTVTTDEPHGFVPGRRFRAAVEPNLTGEYSVQSVLSANVFTFVSTSSTSGNEIDILRLANYTRSGNQVTVTTSTTHKLRVNMVISINSSSGNVPNGEYKITQILDDKIFRFQTTSSGTTSGCFNVVYPSHPFVDNGGLIGLKLGDGTMGGFTISSVTNTTVLVSSTGFPNNPDGYMWVGNGYSTSNGEITIAYPKNDLVEGEYVFLMFENIFKPAKIQFKGTQYSSSTLSWKLPRTILEYYDVKNGYVRVYRTGYSDVGGGEVQLKIPNHKFSFGDQSINKFYSPPNIVERVTVNDNIFTSSKPMINGSGFLKILPNSTNFKSNILSFFEYGHARTPGENVSFLDEYENGGGFTISGKTYSILTFPPDNFSSILRDDPIPVNPRLVYTFVRSGTNATVTFPGHPFSELDSVRLLFPSNGAPIIIDRQITNVTTNTFTVGGITNPGIIQTGAVDILPVTVNEILKFRTVTEYSHGRTDQDKIFILNSSNDSSEFVVSNPSTDTYAIITGSGFDFSGKNIIQSFSSSSQDVTVSMKNHGYIFGNEVRLIFPQFNGDSTNVAFSDNYTVTSTTTNTFNVTIPTIQDSSSSPVVVTVKSIITPGSFIRITEYNHARQDGDMIAIIEPSNIAYVFPLEFVDSDTYDLDISGSSGSFAQPRLISTFDATGNGTVTVSAKNHGYTQGQIVGLVFPIFIADSSNVQFSGSYQVISSSTDSFSVNISGIQAQISSPVIVTPSISDEIERDIKVISELGHTREIDDKVALVNLSGSSHVFDIIERDINSYVVDVTDTDVTNPRPIQVFGKSGTNIIVTYNNHGYQQQQRVYLRFPKIIGSAISNEEFSGQYIISSVSTNTFTVNLPDISNQQDSPVEVFEASEVKLQTVKRISEPGHGRQSGDEIGLVGLNNISSYFQVSNFSSATEFDVLVGKSVDIEFPEIINSFSSTNSIITVASRGHGYVENDRVALTFPPQAKFSMDHWITNNLDITAQPTSTTGAYDWRSVTWAPEIGLFVAVSRLGDINRIITSPDGINWTQRVSPNTNSLFSVDWSPELGLFAVVSITGEGNRVITSPDGINWTSRSTPLPNKNWNRVKWIPDLGIFVAVAYSGVGERVMTSPDGINWTSRQSANDNNWSDLEWSPELSLIVSVATATAGLPNRIMTSPDGINWTERVSPGDVGWSSVAWSAPLGLFAAVGFQGEDHRLMTSPDGINWTLKPAPVVAIWRYIRWISELGIFLAVSDRGVDQPDSYIMTSKDAINWELYNTGPTNNWFNFIWANELQRLVIVSGEPIPKIVTSTSYPVLSSNSIFNDIYTITNVSQNHFEVSNPGLGVQTESLVRIDRVYTRGSLKVVIEYTDQLENNQHISLLGDNGSANIYKAINIRQSGYAIFGGSLSYPSLPRRVSTYDSEGGVVKIYSRSYSNNIQIVNGSEIRLIFHTTDGDSTNNSFSGNYTAIVPDFSEDDPIIEESNFTVSIPGINNRTRYSVEIVFKSTVSGNIITFTIPSHTYADDDKIAVIGTNDQVGVLNITQISDTTISVNRHSNTYTNPRIIYIAESSNQIVTIYYPDHLFEKGMKIGLILFNFSGNDNSIYSGEYTINDITEDYFEVIIPGISDQISFPVDITQVYSPDEDVSLNISYKNHPFTGIEFGANVNNGFVENFNLINVTQDSFSITLPFIPLDILQEGKVDFVEFFELIAEIVTISPNIETVDGDKLLRFVKLPSQITSLQISDVYNSVYGIFPDLPPRIFSITEIFSESEDTIEFRCEPSESVMVVPSYGARPCSTYYIDQSIPYSRPFGVIFENVPDSGVAVVTRLSTYNRNSAGVYTISDLPRNFEVGDRIFARFIDAPESYTDYNRGDIDAQNDIFTITGITSSVNKTLTITVSSQITERPFTNGMVVVDLYITLPSLPSVTIPSTGQASISPLISYRVGSGGVFTFFEESLRFNNGDDVFIKFTNESIHTSKKYIVNNKTSSSFSVTDLGTVFAGERRYAFIEKLVLPGTTQLSISGNTGLSLVADYTRSNDIFTVDYPLHPFDNGQNLIVSFYDSNITRDVIVTSSTFNTLSFSLNTSGITLPLVRKLTLNRIGNNFFELFNLTTQTTIFTFDPIGRNASYNIPNTSILIGNVSQLVLQNRSQIYSTGTSAVTSKLTFIPSESLISSNQLRISMFKLNTDLSSVAGEAAFSTGSVNIENLGFIDQGLGASRIKEGIVRHDKKSFNSSVYITFRIFERMIMYYYESNNVLNQRQLRVFSGSILIGIEGGLSLNNIVMLSTLRQSTQSIGFVTTTSIDVDLGPRGDANEPNMYICGTCRGAIDFRGTVKIGDVFLDTRLFGTRGTINGGAFLCKINSTGGLEWFTLFDGSEEESAVSVAVNSDTQDISAGIYGIYVLGSFTSDSMDIFESRKGSINRAATSASAVETIRKSITSRDNLIQRESYILKFNQDGQYLVTYKTSSTGLLTPVYLDVGSGDNVVTCMKSFSNDVSLKEPDGRVARYIRNPILYDVGILMKYRTSNFLNIDASEKLRPGQLIRKKIINKSPFSLYVPVYTSSSGFGRLLTNVYVVPDNSQILLTNNKDEWYASASEKLSSDLLTLDRDNGKFGFGISTPLSTVDVRGDLTVAGLGTVRDIMCDGRFFSKTSLKTKGTVNQTVNVILPSSNSYYLTWIPNLFINGTVSTGNSSFVAINGVYNTQKLLFRNILRFSGIGPTLRNLALGTYIIQTSTSPQSVSVKAGTYRYRAFIVNDTSSIDLEVNLVNASTNVVYGTLAKFNSSRTQVIEYSGVVNIPIDSNVRPVFSNNVYQLESRISLALDQEEFLYPYRVNDKSLFPKGIIMIWRPNSFSGTFPNDIPIGWAICDGRIQNGVQTPDLRGRFVLGSNENQFRVGDVSGENRTNLAISQIPSHNHIIPWRNQVLQANGGRLQANNNFNASGIPTFPSESLVLAGLANATGFTGNGTAHNNMPPYYVLVYICKV